MTWTDPHTCVPIRTVSPGWVGYICLGCQIRWGYDPEGGR